VRVKPVGAADTTQKSAGTISRRSAWIAEPLRYFA
jgi:hypothetical protein